MDHEVQTAFAAMRDHIDQMQKRHDAEQKNLSHQITGNYSQIRTLTRDLHALQNKVTDLEQEIN